MNDNMTARVNDFFRKSLSFVDDQDLKREFSETQSYYGKKLLDKDLEINSLDSEISYWNDKTAKMNNNIENTRNNLSQLKDSLKI